MFVKSIVTFPALALSEVVLYLSWPSVLADRLSVCPPLAPPAGAGVEAVAELDVVGVAAGLAGVEDEEELFEELPQPPASVTSTVTASVSPPRETLPIDLALGVACLLIASVLPFFVARAFPLVA
jgi:hypothetical protein